MIFKILFCPLYQIHNLFWIISSIIKIYRNIKNGILICMEAKNSKKIKIHGIKKTNNMKIQASQKWNNSVTEIIS